MMCMGWILYRTSVKIEVRKLQNLVFMKSSKKQVSKHGRTFDLHFLKAAVECSAMRCGQCCILCSSEATYRCVQCASWSHYCATCFGKVHSKANIFHVGEIWEVRVLYNSMKADHTTLNAGWSIQTCTAERTCCRHTTSA